MNYDRTTSKQIKGKMYLMKNGKPIRDYRFGCRSERRYKMDEWRDVVTNAEPAEYFIHVILDQC